MAWKPLDEMDLAGKTVLTRVDLNVPVSDGQVGDRTRIERIRPTVQAILEGGGRPVLLAHFDRPKGKVVPEMSLGQVRDAVAQVLGVEVVFQDTTVGAQAEAAVAALQPGQVLMLENTRFDPGEEANDADFADRLARLGDVYCNDAFSAAHRAHASTEALAHRLPACAGRAMEAELKALEGALSNPDRPLLAVVGGAKVSSKLDLLGNLIGRVDGIVIGGGMANTFLAAEGKAVGRSLHEADLIPTAQDIMRRAEAASCRLHLPADVVVAAELKPGAESRTVAADACPDDMMILDFGPDAVTAVAEAIGGAKTLVWNGPLGAFEVPPFDAATRAAARVAAERTKAGALMSVAGGGDTVAALNAAGVAGDFSYISTAGGAFLEWLEGKTLPGVAALG